MSISSAAFKFILRLIIKVRGKNYIKKIIFEFYMLIKNVYLKKHIIFSG